ncbi:Tryptophan--tRNA ligase [Phytophthora cinnamomi]|uniref:Tryptophan--tRNA ligase n=1 Tax=Phytophthora cinnamomi TaxID=4785 RepID=UPI003559DFAA|nr:Tryptophan--tRNA ligase [Phytophthora cinnamomi]
MSGFCEVEDIDTGERFQVMQRHCTSLKGNVQFRCSDAPAFVNYRFDGQAAVNNTMVPGFSLPHINISDNVQTPRDGIVMVVYPQLLASAYATVRLLRDVLKCRLPIEIWFHVDEIGDDYALLSPLQQLAIMVGEVSFHPMYNPRAKGFLSKVFAIYNSHFDRVLFLDADNVPHKLTGERDEKLEKEAMENKVVPPQKALGAPQPDGYPDPVIWTHLLSYRKGASRRLYSIDAYRADPEFPEWQPCYGKRYVEKQKLFELQEFASLSFAGIETDIRHFAMEAARILQAQGIALAGRHPTNSTQD